MKQSERNKKLRELIDRRGAVLMPGAANGLGARIIEECGFEAVYLSGAGLTNTYYGLPDLGFVGLADLVQHTIAISGAVDLPVLVDVDTGFGNAVNAFQTVRTLERAGASGIQIEDQVSPKRCGHFEGKDVVPTREAVEKIRACVDAREDPNFVIVARTDARAIDDFEAAIERAEAFLDAGADMTFVEAPQSVDEIREIPRRLAAPQLINMVIGGKTPPLAQSDLAEFGYSIALYANLTLQAASLAMRQALDDLKEGGLATEDMPVASFEERQRLVRKSKFDDLESRYSGGDA